MIILHTRNESVVQLLYSKLKTCTCSSDVVFNLHKVCFVYICAHIVWIKILGLIGMAIVITLIQVASPQLIVFPKFTPGIFTAGILFYIYIVCVGNDCVTKENISIKMLR